MKDENLPFGLCVGQMRVRRIMHNCGWYNKVGEFLGWGDLSEDDINRIAREISAGDAFFILPERAPYDNPRLDDNPHPGIQEVINWCTFMITKECVYFVSDYGQRDNELKETKIKHMHTTRADLKKIIEALTT